MTNPLPQAFVTHQIRGRIRLRVPTMRNQAPYFEGLRQRLSTLPGLHRLTTNTRTGSVLIEHTGELEAIDSVGRRLELFEVGERPHPHSLNEMFYAVGAKPDSFLKNVTDGRVELSSLAVVALAGLGIKQIIGGYALPAGWTLIWNAINLVMDSGKPLDPVD
jgi:Heavy metal associated domain 2